MRPPSLHILHLTHSKTLIFNPLKKSSCVSTPSLNVWPTRSFPLSSFPLLLQSSLLFIIHPTILPSQCELTIIFYCIPYGTAHYDWMLGYQNTYTGYQGTRIPGYQDTRIPGYQDTRIPGYQDTSIPEYQDSKIPGYQDNRVPGYQGTEDFSLEANNRFH